MNKSHPFRQFGIIISLVATAVAGVLCLEMASTSEVLLVPQPSVWPPDVISATKRFASLRPDQRSAEGKILWSFFGHFVDHDDIRLFFARRKALHHSVIENMLGTPSYKNKGTLFYDVEDHDSTRYSLVFKFRKGYLVGFGIGNGYMRHRGRGHRVTH